MKRNSKRFSDDHFGPTERAVIKKSPNRALLCFYLFSLEVEVEEVHRLPSGERKTLPAGETMRGLAVSTDCKVRSRFVDLEGLKKFIEKTY